jgi:hypothetical protein
MYNIDLDLLPNITYDANGNILLNGAPIPNTPSVNLDNTNIFSTTNDAGQAYVPAGAASSTGGDPTLSVDYTDAMAMLNSPFAQTDVFSSSKLDGFDDVTGEPSLFEDLLIQGAGTRVGLNEAANTISNNTDTLNGGAGTDIIDGGGGTDTIPSSTAQELYDALVTRGLGSTAQFFMEGSTNLDDIIARYGGDESFMDLVNRYDPTTMPEFTGSYTYNPYNQGFGSGTGRNQVFYVNPLTGNISMGLASEVSAQFPGITTYNSAIDATVANPDITTTTDTTTNTGPNYEDLYGNLVNEYQRLLNQQNQQNQPSSQTGIGDMSGLMGLLNQFMQSRNSLQGGGRYNNMYGTMYGGGMGYGSPYGNPFNSGMGYGYGMNPYAGGIGSFYGNTGLGFSPSGYNSGYGSGYGMNNMFYGGYGGNNYNQMAYNPYSSLYNQLSNPQTYGYSGDVYTPEYNSYLNTPFEGNRYSQGYQDYLQQNNPGVYTNLFGGAV